MCLNGGSNPVKPSSCGHTTPCPVTPPNTPLTKSVLDGIAKCPAMATDLDNLQRNGWTVVWGTPGGGYFSDKSTKVITLDPNKGTSADNVVTMLSHEMGHAKFTPTNVTPNRRTRAEYVRDKVQSNLEDEGEATLTQIEYKGCLKKGGGPNVAMYGKSAEYEAIAKKYPDPSDRAKARTEIANIYGDNEHPSPCPDQTYRQFYEKACCEPACGSGAKRLADSPTDDQWKAAGGKI
jgi:hypothetical protein